MAICTIIGSEFDLIPILDGVYATCVLEQETSMTPDLALSIDPHRDDDGDVELLLHGNNYGHKVFSTYHPQDWAEFDYLFGREEWQALLEETRKYNSEEMEFDMAIYSLKEIEFTTEKTLGGWYETAVLRTTEEGNPEIAISIDYDWCNDCKAELVLHGEKYGRKVLSTNSPREWPEFDALFGRKEWQQFVKDMQEAALKEYDDELENED